MPLGRLPGALPQSRRARKNRLAKTTSSQRRQRGSLKRPPDATEAFDVLGDRPVQVQEPGDPVSRRQGFFERPHEREDVGDPARKAAGEELVGAHRPTFGL